MATLSEICYGIYEKEGYTGVIDFVRANHPELHWGECEPCEANMPFDSDGDCLVCATPRTRIDQKKDLKLYIEVTVGGAERFTEDVATGIALYALDLDGNPLPYALGWSVYDKLNGSLYNSLTGASAKQKEKF